MARNLGARCRPINEGHPVCAIKRPDEAKTAPKVTNMIEDFVAGTACEANNLGEPGPQRKLRAASHGRAVSVRGPCVTSPAFASARPK